MPANFPELWLTRVIQNITTTDKAMWLDGIPEVESEVYVLGEGTVTEKNIIHVPTSDFKPEVLINNTTYPLALQEYTDDEVIIALDKYQTRPTSISDDSAMGSSYDKIDTATGKHTVQMTSSKYKKAIHAIAPSAAGTDKFVIPTTGEDDGTGRRMMRYEDLVAVRKQFASMADGEGIIEEIRIVLSPDH